MNELSVRRGEGVGGIFRGIKARGQLSELEHDRIIILVHGFNVSADAARSTYQRFLASLVKEDFRFSLEGFCSYWGFHWPGDHDTAGMLSSLVAKGTFSIRIEQAGTAGRQLARLLERMRPDQNVYFIAHSLGCRVVLETLYGIAELTEGTGGWAGAAVRGAFLMAAAVPYMFCEEEPDDEVPASVPHYFRRRPGEPVEWVFYSPRDRVLNKPFVSGEWLHGEGGGEAVGRHGFPLGRWHMPVKTGLGHGGYWGDKKRVIVSNVPSMFGLTTRRGNRNLAVLQGPEQAPIRVLRERKVPLRPIGAPLDGGWQVILKET